MKELSEEMDEWWSEKAKVNARKYICLESYRTDDEFDKSGLIDANKILQDINPSRRWKVLEIGVGIGRVAKHFADTFTEICAVDCSNEMVKAAKARLKGYKSIKIFQNSGNDLSIFPNETFDFVYSVYTFQHVPRKIFENYLEEVYRVLKNDGLFKFQIFEKTKLFVIPWFWLRNLRRLHVRFWQHPPDNDFWVARSYSRIEIEKVLKMFEIVRMDNPTGKESDLWVLCKKAHSSVSNIPRSNS